MPEQTKNRLVELLTDLCQYGDIAETPWPVELCAPTWEQMTPLQQTAWMGNLDEERRTRSAIAASIQALVYGGKGGNILTAARDEELGTLLKQAGSHSPLGEPNVPS